MKRLEIQGNKVIQVELEVPPKRDYDGFGVAVAFLGSTNKLYKLHRIQNQWWWIEMGSSMGFWCSPKNSKEEAILYVKNDINQIYVLDEGAIEGLILNLIKEKTNANN